MSITALFSGLFIVVMGGLADKIGRVRITLLGLVANIVGSILVVLAAGAVALPLMLAGRAVQGFSAACIMPATMALVKTYWDGAGRQRAVSMWSIGSWGGSGFAALLGGAVSSSIGWRYIFIASIVITVISILMILGTPESKVEGSPRTGFDFIGLIIFMISALALMIVLIFGKQLGWASLVTLVLGIVAVAGITVFVLWERRQATPFVDFALFSNTTFTGATISNFILNATIGLLIVSQQMLQRARPAGSPEAISAWGAGLYAGIRWPIIAFIRLGQKLLGEASGLGRADDLGLADRRGLLPAAHPHLGAARHRQDPRRGGLRALRSRSGVCPRHPVYSMHVQPLPTRPAGAGIYKMASSGRGHRRGPSASIFTALLGTITLLLGNTRPPMTSTRTSTCGRRAWVVMLFNLLLALAATPRS